MTKKTSKAVLLMERDVIVRMTIAAHLRACSYTVVEASGPEEAKAILQSGRAVDIAILEAQPRGGESGFALAQWVRRYRAHMEVMLVHSLETKAETVVTLCGRFPDISPPSGASGLIDRIKALLAERRRRAKPSTSAIKGKRRRGAS